MFFWEMFHTYRFHFSINAITKYEKDGLFFVCIYCSKRTFRPVILTKAWRFSESSKHFLFETDITRFSFYRWTSWLWLYYWRRSNAEKIGNEFYIFWWFIWVQNPRMEQKSRLWQNPYLQVDFRCGVFTIYIRIWFWF